MNPFRRIRLIYVLCVLIIIFCGCAGSLTQAPINKIPEGYAESLPKELEQEVLAAWLAKEGHELGYYKYYGTYGDCVVLFRATQLQAITTKTIGESEFSYNTSFWLKVYYQGKFISLEEAYEKGLLSKAQIALIAEYHKIAKNYR